MNSNTSAPKATAQHGAVLVVTCLALATVVSAMSSLNVALPSIARATHASQTQLSWIIDAYSLIFASLLLPGGAIGDRFGRRKSLIAGLAIFGVGCVVASFTTDAHELIVLRGVLGVGGALVMPATLSTITSTFPSERRASAVAGGSALIGLLASGALLLQWSWKSVFLFNVVLAVIAIAGTLRFVPESADSDAPPIDVVGAVIATVGLIAVVYSIIQAPTNGWGSATTLIGLLGGLAVLAGFVGWELHAEHPLLDPRLFRRRPFAAGTLSISLQFFSFFGFVFVVMQYLQLVRGDSPMISAVSVIPMAATMMPSARLTPRIVTRIGSRACITLGLSLGAGGMFLLGTLGETSPYWRLLIGLIPLGAGMGLAMTPATTAVTDALPPALQGVGSAMNDLARELGGALGIAVLGSLLSASYRSHLALPGLPPAAAAQARSSLAVAAHLGPSVLAQARAAFTDGMHVALYSGAGAALGTALIVFVALRPSRRTPMSSAAGHRLDVDERRPTVRAGDLV
jgi:EmrB/QacA subfamily drug resistance transporter